MIEEIRYMVDNHAFFLCDLPPGRKSIGCKWVYKIKRNANNKFERCRARIVAKGYSQVFHIDFNKTYAPVVRIDSIRHIFALAAFYRLYILHADAKTAFVNGNSDVELYIDQPQGFIDRRYPHKVLRLNRSLYGLKQASRIWYLLLCKTIIEYGFEPLISDECIFISPNRRMIILVYVDDVLIISSDQAQCQEVYNYLAQHFRMNNLGEPTTFLGMRITRDWNAHTISLDQTAYIDRMLARFDMSNCVPANTPLDPSLPLYLRQPNEKQADQNLYQQIIGSLNHLAVYSRPDIAFAVSKLAQFNRDPSTTHLNAARHILRYLCGTRTFKITYGKSPDLVLIGYADASHGGDWDDGKSTTGYVFLLNNGPISWNSHKQSSVSVSTTEAEYMSLSDAAREAISRTQLFKELGVNIPVPAILSDNQSALATVEGPTQHQRAKHIRIRYHLIRDAYRQQDISLGYVPTKDQTADILTKALHPPAHHRCVSLMGLST